MIFEGLSNLLLYILIASSSISSIILFFMSKDIIQQGRVNKNYDEERKTCKFRHLTKRDKAIIHDIINQLYVAMYNRSIKFKFNKNTKTCTFKDFSESIKGWDFIKTLSYAKKYGVDSKATNEYLYILLGGESGKGDSGSLFSQSIVTRVKSRRD